MAVRISAVLVDCFVDAPGDVGCDVARPYLTRVFQRDIEIRLENVESLVDVLILDQDCSAYTDTGLGCVLDRN